MKVCSSKLTKSFFKRKLLIAIFSTCSCTGSFAQPASHLTISQVYGGGGNIGAQFTNDFIEIFNPTGSTIALNGWTVQYAAAASASWSITPLTGSINPGSYYLIQESSGGNSGNPLPTPDLIGTQIMSATAGKVALCNSMTVLSGNCPVGGIIVDFIGYGIAADCFEGTGSAPAPGNTKSVFRADNGCTDTDQNAADFSQNTPNPRNSSYPANNCALSEINELNIEAESDLKVFPNPTENYFTTTGLNSNAEVVIDLFNSFGEKVFSSKITTLMDVSALPKGLYWIIANDGTNAYKRKLIKN